MATGDWFVACVSFFVACVAGVALMFLLYKEDILMWYMKLSNEWQRDDYIEENRAKLESDLRDSLDDLVIYLDEELDAAHLKKEEEFKKEGMRYLFYPDKSYEVAILKGHCILFTEHAVKKLMHMFWAPRWMLLRYYSSTKEEDDDEIERLKRSAMDLVTRFMYEYRTKYCLGHLRVDNETRQKERKRLLAEQNNKPYSINEQ